MVRSFRTWLAGALCVALPIAGGYPIAALVASSDDIPSAADVAPAAEATPDILEVTLVGEPNGVVDVPIAAPLAVEFAPLATAEPAEPVLAVPIAQPGQPLPSTPSVPAVAAPHFDGIVPVPRKAAGVAVDATGRVLYTPTVSAEVHLVEPARPPGGQAHAVNEVYRNIVITTGNDSSQFHAADAASQALAADLRARMPGGNVAESDRHALRQHVQQAFDARQELIRKEIAEFRQRLERLNQLVQQRDEARDRIVARRVEELLSPNLQWNPEGEAVAGVARRATRTVTARVPYAHSETSRADVVAPSPVGAPTPAPETKPLAYDAGVPAIALSVPPQRRDVVVTRTQNGKVLTENIIGIPEGHGIPQPSPVPTPRPTPHPERGLVQAKVFPLRHAKADALATTLTKLAGDDAVAVKVSADAATNSLVVLGRPDDLKMIESLIQQLDTAPAAPTAPGALNVPAAPTVPAGRAPTAAPATLVVPSTGATPATPAASGIPAAPLEPSATSAPSAPAAPSLKPATTTMLPTVPTPPIPTLDPQPVSPSAKP